MPLRGELGSVDLAHIFQMLVLNQKEGTLEIEHAGVKRPVHFMGEGIHVPADPDLLAERAAGALARAGELSAADLVKARTNMAVVGKDLLGTLVEMKVLTAERRIEALRAQLEEEVYELFFLKEGSFVFRDGELPEGTAVDQGLALSPTGLIMEAARRIDEWDFIRTLVASGDHIVEARNGLEALDPRENDADAKAVHAAVDGVRTVDQIIDETGIARFVVYRKIALLLDQGILAAVPPDELVERGRRCLEAGNVDSAARLYERAIALGADQVAVLAGAGQAHESLGDLVPASRRYLEAGRRAESNGDLDAALRLYRRIREILPTQVEARERLFALRKLAAGFFGPAEYEPEREGFELARILFELERGEELALVLSGLLDLAAEDAELVERTGELAAQLGQMASAIDAMLRAAELRERERDHSGAIRCLKQAQALDPSRGDLSDQMRRLTDAARTRRERRTSLYRALAMAAGFALLFLGYGRYSAAAMKKYAEYSVEDFLVAGRFDAGREHFRAIQWRYPLTVPFLLSFEKLRELDVAERNSAEIERYRSAVQDETEAGNRRQARKFQEAALSARHTGNYTEALDLLRRARRLSGADDELGLEADIAALESYLAEARRLASEAVFFRNAGRFDEAHARLGRLLESFRNAPEAEGVLLPVKITSDPERARIAIDGKPLRVGSGQFQIEAETPFVVDVPADRSVRLTLTLDGYAPLERGVGGREQVAIHCDLARRPDQETVLSRDVAHGLAATDDVVFCALEAGRFAALDAATMAVKWACELPDLAEAAAPPSVERGMVVVPVAGRRLLLLDAENGAVRRAIGLPGRPVSAAALDGGRVAVALAGGGLAVGDLAAEELAAVEPPVRVTVGPLALGGGRFAVGGEDGKVWILAADGSFTSLFDRGAAKGGAHALCRAADGLLLGDGAGQVHLFEPAGRGHVWSTQVLPSGPVDRVAAAAEHLAASGGGRLALLDAASGRVRASLDHGLDLSSVFAGGVVATAADGGILVLDAAALAIRGRYVAAAPIRHPGVSLAQKAVIAAGSGRVVAIFPASP